MNDLVSCVMLTADRPEFARLAMRSFGAQDYSRRELLILDSGRRPLFKSRRDATWADYVRVEPTTPRATVGELRNLANSLATGDTICHWDDDDWSARLRLSAQVEQLRNNYQMTAFNAMLFYNEGDRRCYFYRGLERYALATSMCYRREVWRARPFPNIDICEHAWWDSIRDQAKATMPAGNLMVGRIHAGNTSKKLVEKSPWESRGWAELPRDFLYALRATFPTLDGKPDAGNDGPPEGP